MRTLNISNSQKGLAYFPEFAIYCTYYLKSYSLDNHQLWRELAQKIDDFCIETGYKTVVILGTGFELWKAWSKELDYSLPKGLGSKATLDKYSQVFGNSGGDLWFHIKSDDKQKVDEVFRLIHKNIEEICTDNALIVPANKRYDGKVMGGRFTDGLINPGDAEDLSSRTVIGEDDMPHRGGAFMMSQKFVHDWNKLNSLTELEKENMIGRDRNDRIIPMKDQESHIKRVRQLDGERINFRILRQALPYGHKEDNKAHEEGIFFTGYVKATHVLDSIITGIAGTEKEFIEDSLFSNTSSDEGSYWYIPNLEECGINANAGNEEVTMNEYFNIRSQNGYMFYNAKDYQHKVRNSKLTEDCPLTDRILRLIDHQFSRWHDTWYKPRETPPLGHLRDYISEDEKHILEAPVILRKGKATQISLSQILVSPEYSEKANLLSIEPDEIIVGNMPQLSLGIGSQVLEYLNENEKISGSFGMLNEYSATGHNAPDYSRIIEYGIDGIRKMYREKMEQSSGKNKDFYQSVVWALEGLSGFIEAYAKRAEDMAKDPDGFSPEERENLSIIGKRMYKIAHQKPTTFTEGLNLVFLVNCSLHQTGEPMSIGRMDQFMHDLYKKDIESGRHTNESIQEIIDSFWLKMDETVLYNYNHLNDYLNYGTGAVFYSAGNFPQGAAINQWVQQLTVGGTKANNNPNPEDASNKLTLMCLRSARRLPLNAPCLSLRVHKNMSDELFEEAAKALLSGGAHPILLNDDKLVPALQDCGPLSLEDARDYVCDGCYEPIIQGKTEWAFSYVPILPFVGTAMNQGATISGAGPEHLRGLKTTWNSPAPENIHSFDAFMDIFYTQWKWAICSFYNTLMNGYGDLSPYCPSPLFSAFLDDTLETGRDLTNAGARYHIVAPMLCGITNAINALFVIKKLVYDEETVRCSLPQLLRALQCNWGEDMIMPYYTKLEGKLRREEDAAFFKELRKHALDIPKFGVNATDELREFAKNMVARCIDIVHENFDNPLPEIQQAYDALKKKYDTHERSFAFTITPGVGTFEDNVGLGMSMGASADGRLSGQPIADDFAASPWPDDLPFNPQTSNPFTSLNDWNIEPINHGMANCAPVDLNIPEDFSLEKLTGLIRDFAHGKLGSNMITVTCADPDTYEGAMKFPERYDLVRVRMGGWSEFYVAMFDFHQQYIKRRPYYMVKNA